MTANSERLAVSSKKAGENSMFRRIVVCLLLTLFLVPVVFAQQPAKLPRIGFLSLGTSLNPERGEMTELPLWKKAQTDIH